jgi:hypothetical protein
MDQPSRLTDEEMRRFWRAVPPFHLIYKHVTAFMVDRLRDLGNSTEAHWLLFLIDHFRDLYQRWSVNPDLRDYLRLFIRPRQAWLVRVSGFVYLHISHDLPIVIARSLDQGRGSYPPAIDINQARHLYLSLNPYFPDVFLRAARSGDLGFVPRVSSYFPGAKQAASVLAQWALALRMVAWVHGEMIQSLGGPSQLHLDRLREVVTEAARKAARRFWILGLPIEPPTLTPMIFPIALLQIGFQPNSAGLLLGLSLSLFVCVSYLWFYLQRQFIAFLGRELLVGLSTAFAGKWVYPEGSGESA